MAPPGKSLPAKACARPGHTRRGSTEACPPPLPESQFGKAQEIEKHPLTPHLRPLKGAPELPRV